MARRSMYAALNSSEESLLSSHSWGSSVPPSTVTTISRSSACSSKCFSAGFVWTGTSPRLCVATAKPRTARSRRMESEGNQFADTQEETTSAVEAELAGDLVNQGTVLLAMRELRTTIRRELQSVKADMVKLLEMQTSVMGKMVVLDATVQGLGDSGSMQTVAAGTSRKRAYRSEHKLPMLSATFSDANAAVPLLQLACIITTTSASKRIPQLQGLVSDSVVNYLGGLQSAVEQATGFGTPMFAVRGNVAKSKFKYATGQLWLFWVKKSMSAAITYAKKYMFCVPDVQNDEAMLAGDTATAKLPKEPDWMTS